MASVTKRPKEEMARLWEEFKRTHDPAIKNLLSEEYYPIVRYVADKMIERLPHNVQVEDLVSTGVFGLFDAIEKFDLLRGVKFETYCVNRIRGAMLDELFREVSGASIVSMQRRPLDKDPNQLGVDIMEDGKIEGPLPATTRKDLLEYCKKRLSTKERYILMMYYSEDLTLKEIGQILDLSESRVCQLHAKLISRLRAYLKTKKVEIA